MVSSRTINLLLLSLITASTSSASSGLGDYIAAGVALSSAPSTATQADRDGDSRQNWVSLLNASGSLSNATGSGTQTAAQASAANSTSLSTTATVSGAVITLDSETFTAYAQPSGRVVLGHANFIAGQDIIVHGHTLRDAATAVIVDGIYTESFSALPTGALPLPSAHWQGPNFIVDIASETLTLAPQSSGRVVIDGVTLKPGQDTVIAGQHLRIAPTGLIVDGQTVTFGTAATPTSGAVLTLGSTTVTALAQPSGLVDVGDATLKPGQDKVIGSATLRDVQTGIVINGQTTAAFSALSTSAAPAPTTTTAQSSTASAQSSTRIGAILTVGSETVTVVPQASGFVEVNGATLVRGQDTVIGGHTIRNAASALIVDGVTQVFASATPTGTGGAAISSAVASLASEASVYLAGGLSSFDIDGAAAAATQPIGSRAVSSAGYSVRHAPRELTTVLFYGLAAIVLALFMVHL